jgi:hypothetical protein
LSSYDLRPITKLFLFLPLLHNAPGSRATVSGLNSMQQPQRVVASTAALSLLGRLGPRKGNPAKVVVLTSRHNAAAMRAALGRAVPEPLLSEAFLFLAPKRDGQPTSWDQLLVTGSEAGEAGEGAVKDVEEVLGASPYLLGDPPLAVSSRVLQKMTSLRWYQSTFAGTNCPPPLCLLTSSAFTCARACVCVCASRSGRHLQVGPSPGLSVHARLGLFRAVDG